MDTEDLIKKCQAIVLKEEEEDTVTMMEKMKATGEKIATNCLVGKVMQTRGVNREGLKAAMQQAWRTAKEVKIESMGENIFLFKFATAAERKRVFTGGPWHFDRALLILAEPSGIGDIQKQSFTHTSFWVQIHNVPIMCMARETIKKLGDQIGIVEDIEADEAGECIGQFARVRISINVTQPLKKVVFLQQEGEKIPMPILYEKLLDFCFCCAHIGHQFKECLKYKGQPKEELPYGAWMKAITQAERVKLNRSRERRSWEYFQSNIGEKGVYKPKASQAQQDPKELNWSNLNEMGAKIGDETGATSKYCELETGGKSLMQCIEMMENLQQWDKSRGRAINQQQNRLAENDGVSKIENIEAGSKMWREPETVEANKKTSNVGSAKTDVEEVNNGPKKSQIKPKTRRWKLQARVQKMEKGSSSEQINSKRPNSEIFRPSPENKRRRLLSPLKQTRDQDQFNHVPITRQLKLADTERSEEEDAAAKVEDIRAGAGDQPRQQP